jgi:hypothetical protein
VALVSTDVSCQGDKNRRVRNVSSNNVIVILLKVLRLLVTANVSSSPILVTLIMGRHGPPKRRLLQEPHGVRSQKTAFFLSRSVYTSTLEPTQTNTSFSRLPSTEFGCQDHRT